MWASAFDTMSICFNLVIALSLGMMIGIERQMRQRHTGLNTHAVVSLGAAAFTSLATLLPGEIDVRLGGQVVTGIGFLGAGLIMRDGLNVRGLAGAGTVWATGAVGTLAGYGFLVEALETTILVVLVNLMSPRLSRIVERFRPEDDLADRYYMIALKCAADDETRVRASLMHAVAENRMLRLQSLESHGAQPSGSVEVEAMVFGADPDNRVLEALVAGLRASSDIFSARWTVAASPD